MTVQFITFYKISERLAVERNIDDNSIALNFHGTRLNITHEEWAQLRKLTNQVLVEETFQAETQLILQEAEPF